LSFKRLQILRVLKGEEEEEKRERARVHR